MKQEAGLVFCWVPPWQWAGDVPDGETPVTETSVMSWVANAHQLDGRGGTDCSSGRRVPCGNDLTVTDVELQHEQLTAAPAGLC